MGNDWPLIYKTNFKKRIFATIIDYGLYILFLTAYIEWFGHANDEGGKTVNGVVALPMIIAWFLYFVCTEAYFGATPAHLGFSLKVLKTSRTAIGFSDAFKRHVLDFIDILFYGIPASIAIKKTDKHQRLGDLWAGTIVVDTTDSEQYSQV